VADVTADELLKRAAACRDCGKEHEYRQVETSRGSWAAGDGHAYRPVVDIGIVAKLRYLATGSYVDPWLLPKQTMASKIASAIGLST
jgi:hypothetical protein